MLRVSVYIGVCKRSSESYKLNLNIVPFIMFNESLNVNISIIPQWGLDFNKSVFLIMLLFLQMIVVFSGKTCNAFTNPPPTVMQ